MKLLILALCLMPTISHAATGTLEASATVIDPLTMPLEEALELCNEHPYLIKCERLMEKIKQGEHSGYYVSEEGVLDIQ